MATKKSAKPTKATTKTARKTKATKAPSGKLSQLAAAELVLADAGEPLNGKAMVEAMSAKGYWNSPGGKTPEATLYASLLRQIRDKGPDATSSGTEQFCEHHPKLGQLRVDDRLAIRLAFVKTVVVLMLGFRCVESRQWPDLGNHLFAQRILDLLNELLGSLSFCNRLIKNDAAVLCSTIRSLLIERGRVVSPHVNTNELFVGHQQRIVRDLDDFRMAGPAGTHFLIGRTDRVASAVPTFDVRHSANLLKDCFRTPETTTTECDLRHLRDLWSDDLVEVVGL